MHHVDGVARALQLAQRPPQSSLDTHPDSSEVPSEIITRITEEETWERLCDEWDRMYPNNPVSGDDEYGE